MNPIQKQSEDAAFTQLGEIVDDYVERIGHDEQPIFGPPRSTWGVSMYP